MRKHFNLPIKLIAVSIGVIMANFARRSQKDTLPPGPKPDPCPWCDMPPSVNHGKYWWRIACINDLCRVKPKLETYNTYEEAVKFWNSRPGEEKLRAENQRLKEQITRESQPDREDSQPEEQKQEGRHICGVPECGKKMEEIRPGVWQCPEHW